MGSNSYTCEIVEAREELDLAKNSKRTYQSSSGLSLGDSNREPPVLKLGYRDSLEDDINQLFEAISLKNSSRGLSSSRQAGLSSSPLRKNAMKRPITVGVPHSPRIGNSETVSLKQALRDLCISKASEMAAVKRLSKSTASPGVSEAGRIKSLYNSVVVETSRSGLPMDETKQSLVEISLVPEESKSNYFDKMSHQLQEPNGKSPDQITRGDNEAASMEYEISSSRKVKTQTLKSPDQSALSSPKFAVPKKQSGIGVTLIKNEAGSATRKGGIQAVKSPSQSAHSSRRIAVPLTKMGTGISSVQNDLNSRSAKVGTQAMKTVLVQNDTKSASTKVGIQSLKTELVQKEKCDPATSLACSDSVEITHKKDPSVATSKKVERKASACRSVRKGKLYSLPSSNSGNRGNKLRRSTPRMAKTVMRNKSSVKKKIKEGTASSAYLSNEVINSPSPSTSQLVCRKCQCALRNVTEDSKQDSPVPFSASCAEVCSSNVEFGSNTPDLSSSNYNGSKSIGKVKKNSKSREKGEFSQSSKSSLGDYSTSTSNSFESNTSRPSCCNRPHMSKDVRWKAIRHVKMQDKVLNLRHFNILKKLGCGDIGTVYLAELIGSNCLFAIKVMDNEFLARRKKMPRAQTEREILRMLDHPFLPTLYAQFTSDNLSCLVMEYCPGGDLHVLRQKQPGGSFHEPAARFYVAEVLLALEYLHMLGVIYRDLKPENILVREDGHIMLTDFDLSLRCNVSPTLLKSPDGDPMKVSGPCNESNCMEPFCIEPSCQVPCFSPRFLPAAAKTKKLKAEQFRSLPQLVAEPTDARSNSFVGTHEYLAPEIIKGKGHGAAVDWWTFGIFLYELLYGRTPFKGSCNEETLNNVISVNLRFPDSPLVSFQARDLIWGLLAKDPENRLGTEKGAAEIKQHPFFEGLNWALIRCAIPPELPEYYDYGVSYPSYENSSKYLEYKATGEHLEFELF